MHTPIQLRLENTLLLTVMQPSMVEMIYSNLLFGVAYIFKHHELILFSTSCLHDCESRIPLPLCIIKNNNDNAYCTIWLTQQHKKQKYINMTDNFSYENIFVNVDIENFLEM